MILSRSPLRISLGGGGTDLASYYSDHEGFVISAAINKYVYIGLHKTFWPRIHLKYSQMEECKSAQEIKHPIIREAFQLHEIKPMVELCSMADIPAGTGLGSSGAFTVSLLRALFAYRKRQITAGILAEQACQIEIDILKEPIGKQDQYATAFGGINCFTFRKDGKVEVNPLAVSAQTLNELEDNLLLFFTGFQRPASELLKDQKRRTLDRDVAMIDNLHAVKEMGLKSKTLMESGDLEGFGALMHEHWMNKKKRSSGMSHPQIDEWYDAALKNGAVGGKLVGAGGGGFLMFYANNREKLRRKMSELGLVEVPMAFDFEGAKVLINELNIR